MDVLSSWRPLLDNGRNPVLLITMGSGRLSDIKLKTHPGTWQKVIRISSHSNIHPTQDGKTYPYWPLLESWPKFQYEYNPEQRRTIETVIALSVLQIPEFENIIGSLRESKFSWGQVDLYMPGLDLDQSVVRIRGPITEISNKTKNGLIDITIKDYYDGEIPDFPFSNEFIDKDEFPNCPEEVAGRARRVYIFNDLIDLFPCVQIDGIGKEFYVCEPKMVTSPTKFFIGANQLISNKPRVTTGRTAVTKSEFTKLSFYEPIVEQGSVAGSVFVSGGTGISGEHIFNFFLERLSGIELAHQAKILLNKLNTYNLFDFFAIVNARGNILEIISNRLIQQTNLVFWWYGGKISFLEEHGATNIHNMELGSNLKFKLPNDESYTSDNFIFNAIDVHYRRQYSDPVTTFFNRYAVLIDENYGGKHSKLLAESQKRYGRRYLKVEAGDLHRRQDAYALGEVIAQLTAMKHKRYSYHVDYVDGLKLSLNDRIYLTDTEEGITNAKCRVVKEEFLPTGINVTFQTEDKNV